MNPGLVPCEREGCGHRRGIHKARGACASPACGCSSFVGPADPDPREVPEAEDPVAEAIRSIAGRRISVDVPDGYAVTITLHPILEEDPT